MLIEKRNHIGGNCYDYLDEKTGIIVQKYGPHIFHTNIKKVWEYLNQFTNWNNYVHKVLAYYKGILYPMPINLDTVNKFYNLNLDEKGMKEFLERKKNKLKKIRNSRDRNINLAK